MIQENDVRSRIAALLRNEVSIPDFSRWIADQSWNMHKDSGPVAIDLVSDIQSLIAEHDDSSLSDEALLSAIQEIADRQDFEETRRACARAFLRSQINSVQHSDQIQKQ